MVEEMVCESIFSLLRDLLTEKVVTNTENWLSRKRLFNKIRKHIARYENEIFPVIDENEQLDFTSVNWYIKAHLFDKITPCFNLPEKYQRDCARRNLIEAVYNEAGADTISEKKIVYSYLQIFLQIVEDYYVEKIEDKIWFLAGKTVEEAAALVEDYIKEAGNKIVDAVQYHGSFAEYIDGIKQAPDNTNAFHYRNELLRFHGREAEQKILREFIESDEEISWIAITGPGGTGKSKLLYYFVKEMGINPKWKSLWIHAENCEQFIKFTEWRYPYNLLVVIDYAGTVASDMGKWLECLERSTYHPDKMRFVFIEREGIGEGGNFPLWYQNLKGNGEKARCIERLGWKKNHGMPFFQLSALEHDQLEKIIEDYAKTREKVLSSKQQKWILEKAKKIDRKQGEPRVLIVLFTADAVLENREYKKWDIQHLIDEIIKKYREHWEKVTCQNDEKIFNALLEMLMFATAVGAWTPENTVPELFADSSSIVCSMDSADLEQLISEVNEEKRFEGKLKPLEPDLIGEYFVLDYWTKKKYVKGYLKNVFCSLWEYPLYFAQFLYRCMQNYIKQDAFKYLFQNGMEKLMPQENNVQGAVFFSMLLSVSITMQLEEEAIESIRRLKELSEKYEGNEEIVLAYANGLVNLSNKQDDEEDAKESVRRLEELSEKYEGNEKIALSYAIGLFNLSHDQDEEGAKESVRRLEELSEKYKRNEEMVLVYAKGLFNLSNKQQDEKRAEESVRCLEKLSVEYEWNKEIMLAYAQGLVNLSNKQQDEKRAEESVKYLESLSRKYEGNEEVALKYAQGLVNLSNKQQDEERAQESVMFLKELSRKYEGDEEIALKYAKGLFNLASKQKNEEKARGSIRCLEELNERYKENIKIVLVYVKGLVNFSNKQDEKGAEVSIERLEDLSVKYKENEEIVLAYAQGLVNLSNKQSEERAEKSVRSLEELSIKYEGNKEIALAYSKGLVNLSNKQQDKKKAEKSVRRLEELSIKYEGNEEIMLKYAKILLILLNKQNEKEGKATIERLETLSKKYKDNEKIALAYAQGQIILSNKQSRVCQEKCVEFAKESV